MEVTTEWKLLMRTGRRDIVFGDLLNVLYSDFFSMEVNYSVRKATSHIFTTLRHNTFQNAMTLTVKCHSILLGYL